MSEQNLDVQVSTSENMTIPNVVNTETPQSTPLTDIDFKDVIPEEYGDKAYWNKIKDWDGFFKSFDNAQQMIGKRPASAPDSPDGYNFQAPEDLPEGVEINEENSEAFKQFAHELGLNDDQYQKIMEYELERQKTGIESAKQSKAEQEAEQAKLKEQQGLEFEEMTAKEFGESSEKVINEVSQLLAKYAGGSVESLDDSLDNNTLMMITKTINGIKEDYIKEGVLDSVGSEVSIGHNLEDLKNEWRQRLGNSDVRRNQLHPEHEENENRIKELSQKVYEIEQKQKKR